MTSESPAPLARATKLKPDMPPPDLMSLPSEIRRLIYSFINETLTLKLFLNNGKRISDPSNVKYECQAYLCRDDSLPRALSPSLLINMSRVCHFLRSEIQDQFGKETNAKNIISISLLCFPHIKDMHMFNSWKPNIVRHAELVYICVDGVDRGPFAHKEVFKRVLNFDSITEVNYFLGGPRKYKEDWERFPSYLEAGLLSRREL